MNKVKVVLTILIFGIFFSSLGGSIYAREIDLECLENSGLGNGLAISPDPIITILDTGELSMESSYNFTFTMVLPEVGAGDVERRLSSYRVSYNVGNGWKTVNLPVFVSLGGGLYESTLTLDLVAENNGNIDNFDLMFAPKAGGGDICRMDTQVQGVSVSEDSGPISGTCDDSPIGEVLGATHFTCSNSTHNPGFPNLTVFNNNSECLRVNITANELSCQSYIDNAGLVPGESGCLPCASALDEEEETLDEILRDLEHGDTCPEIEGNTPLTCGGRTDLTCRPSFVQGGTRCLATGVTRVSNPCFGGENECIPFGRASAGQGGVVCMSDFQVVANNNEFGSCGVIACDIGSRPVVEDAVCAGILGVDTAYCVGPTSSQGSCVTLERLESMLRDDGYIDYLEQRDPEIVDVILEELDLLGVDGITITNIGTDNENDDNTITGGTSSDFGIRNCPGARQNFGENSVFFDPSLGASEEEFTQCSICITLRGTWTALGCITATPSGVFGAIVRIAIGIMGGIALLRLIYLGYLYQSGDEGKIAEARKGVLATLGSIILILFSVLFLEILGANILGILPSGFF